jgi:ferric-dicitrate binding protein FerR (iron transport regulator)
MTGRLGRRRVVRGAWTVFLLVVGGGGGEAQTVDCTVSTRAAPRGEMLTCRDGLVIHTERGTLYRLIDRNRDRQPEGAELTGGGLLIELPPGGRGRNRFQIHTPHAIASVRGTIWAADVTAARTSVFVQRGVVAVGRQGVRRTVTLRAGDGVDVEGTAGPLAVRRWAPQRAAALLARFGR